LVKHHLLKKQALIFELKTYLLLIKKITQKVVGILHQIFGIKKAPGGTPGA
jgi:hypothetical protein